MGWFSSLVSKATDFVSNVVSKGKAIASRAVEWLATKAETFVGKVKQVYAAAKPYIAQMRIGLTVLAEVAPWPWLQKGALALERALAFLENLENHPLTRKLKAAIEWLIAQAKDLHARNLNEQEIQEAEARSADLARAVETVPMAERSTVRAAALINDYLLIKAKTARLVNSGDFSDFEHYLRVRAVQRLLQVFEQQMTELQSAEAVNEDPLFIIQVGNVLIDPHATLSDAQVTRLDAMMVQHFGKPVVPFVFEQMVAAWSLEVQTLEASWTTLNKAVAKDRVLKRRLELEAELDTLPAEEAVMLSTLRVTLPQDEAVLSEQGDALRAKRNYIFAAEGLLQLLEKSPEQLQADGQQFLAEYGAEVGTLIIQCAQNDVKWQALEEDQQRLIIDFANIFEADCRARAETLKMVEVGV